MDAEQHAHAHAAAHYTLYDPHDQWAAPAGMFYSAHPSDFMTVAAPPQPQVQAMGSPLAMSPHAGAHSPDASNGGVLTRQRAKQQMLLSQQQPDPSSHGHDSFQSLNAMFGNPYQPQTAHFSPPYPSTPMSSAPSSRAYYSNGARSASPAVSVASTSLTSLSGGHHHNPYLTHHRPMSPECAPLTPASGSASASSGTAVAIGDIHDPSMNNGLLQAQAFDSSLGGEGIAPSSGPRRSRKSRLYNLDRKAICCYARDHPDSRQEEIANRYGVERSTISKILKQKEKWLNMPEGDCAGTVKQRPSKFPALEKRLMIILKQATRDKVQLTDLYIRVKAKEVAKDIGIGEDKFKASSGWVENFKHRHNVRRGVLVGRPSRRMRRTGPDGELTGDEDSDWEDRVEPGEENMTREEKVAYRVAKQQERMQFFRVAEEQILEEYGHQIEAGDIDEELRLELVASRRSDLMRAKKEGKTLQELDAENMIIPERVHSQLEADILNNTPGPNSGKRRAFVIVPAQHGVSGVIPYGSQLQQQPIPIATSSSGYGLASMPTSNTDAYGQQTQFANLSAAIDFIDTSAEAFMTPQERETLFNLRARVQRTTSGGVVSAGSANSVTL